MARNQVDVTVEQGANANGWTELTNDDATHAKFQVKNGAAVIRYSTNDTEPAEGCVPLAMPTAPRLLPGSGSGRTERRTQ